MGRRPLQRTLPGLNPSLLVAALPPRLESGISFLYYAAFGPAPGLSSLLPWPFACEIQTLLFPHSLNKSLQLTQS